MRRRWAAKGTTALLAVAVGLSSAATATADVRPLPPHRSEPAAVSWVKTFSEGFDTPVTLGSWPGPYAAKFDQYQNVPDTSGHGTYNSTHTVSVHDGMLDIFVHTDGSKHYVAALLPRIFNPSSAYAGQVSGRYELAFRTEAIPGYKISFMWWPDSQQAGDGEADFPEGSTRGTIYAYTHFGGPGSAAHDTYNTGVSMTRMHRAAVEWVAGSYVKYYLDGTLVFTSTRASVTKMHLVLQVETAVGGPEPAADAQGHVFIDWIAGWKRNKTSTPGG